MGKSKNSHSLGKFVTQYGKIKKFGGGCACLVALFFFIGIIGAIFSEGEGENRKQNPRAERAPSPRAERRVDDVATPNNTIEFHDNEFEIWSEPSHVPFDFHEHEAVVTIPRNHTHSTFTSNLTVHFIDVGQADAILIELPNGQNMLIDGGNAGNANSILSYIRQRRITTIDYLVATHPHADHIGGLPAIINAMNIGEVFMPRVSHTTQTFERLLTAIQNKGLQINTARAGVNVLSIPGLQIDFVAPVRDDYRNLNDWSAVTRIIFGNTGFLFTGDAEALSESHITADISVDVLQVGHHGSNTSTSQRFLDRVSPRAGVISVGANNSYGHPSDVVLSRLNNLGVYVLRTDLHGTIIFTSDGTDITYSTQRTPQQPREPPQVAAPVHAPPSNPPPWMQGGGASGLQNQQPRSTGGGASNIQSSVSGMVWIPERVGQVFHSRSNCSNMNNPIQITREEAVQRNLRPCSRCH